MRRAFRTWRMTFLIGELAWDVNDVSGNAMGLKILLSSQMALAPLAGRSVGAADEHTDSHERDDDEGHDECNAPCDMGF